MTLGMDKKRNISDDKLLLVLQLIGVLSGTSTFHEGHRQSSAKVEPTHFKRDSDSDMKKEYPWIMGKPSLKKETLLLLD